VALDSWIITVKTGLGGISTRSVDSLLYHQPTAIVSVIITFRVRRSRGEMYSIMVTTVCMSVPRRIPTLYCTDPDVTLGNGIGWPLVVHSWVDLQSVHGFRCYDNIAPIAKCQRVLVLDLCLVYCFYTDHFRGRYREVGRVCVCVCLCVSMCQCMCVRSTTFELHEFRRRYLPWCFSLKLSRSCL